MDNTSPLVSIYIPTKNRSGMLKRAVESVLNQSYKNIEVIVVDDASTDDTPEVMAYFLESDSRVRFYCFDEAKGAPMARNFAIEHAKGEYVSGLDDDDYFLSDRIKHLVESYSDQYAFVCSGCYWDYGKVKTAIHSTSLVIDLDTQLHCNNATNQVLVKKERILAVGGYDTKFVACQDWELWTRLIIEYGAALRIGYCDYVIDTHHGCSRISDNPQRVKGFLQFKRKYKKLMKTSHNNALKFQIAMASNQKISFTEMLGVFNTPVREKAVRYWLRCLFPHFAQFRLSRKKR